MKMYKYEKKNKKRKVFWMWFYLLFELFVNSTRFGFLDVKTIKHSLGPMNC